MYYLLALLLFILLYYIFVKLLSSIVKGCLVAFLVFLLTVIIVNMIRSTVVPVNILGLYRIDNFEIERLD